MKIQKMKIPAILGALLLAGTLSAGAQMNSDSLYKEPYRPQYHFSPEKGWIGDPSGFMYYQGKYHMYWWGKVESTDLVHYQQITPYAMTGTDDNISYFTGSAVIDKNNTAGFGKGAYVAAYTVFDCQNHFVDAREALRSCQIVYRQFFKTLMQAGFLLNIPSHII